MRTVDGGPDHEVEGADALLSAVEALFDLGYDEVELLVLPDDKEPDRRSP